MKNSYIIFTVVFASLTTALQLNAQAPDVPAPAPAQKGKVYLIHATVHTGDGKVLDNATLGFENGKIIFLEANPTFKTDETMGRIVDCTGKHVYPGIIALNTTLGLNEIEAVRSTNDNAETGAFNPNARAIISYNTDSRVTPTVRSNGILYAQITPQGGWVSGTSAVAQLDAWNWEDALVREDGITMNWPSMFRWKGWWAEPEGMELNKEYDKQLNELKTYFREAKAYCETPTHDKENLRFEAMRGLFNGSQNLYIYVGYVKEILNAIAFAEDMKVKLVIVGGNDSYMISDVLAQKKIPVILGRSHSLPSYTEEDIQQPYKTPGQLQQAGVLFAQSVDGFWQSRNISFNAGTSVAYGLTKEQALQSITLNCAKILGLDASIGSLAVGKDASLIVSAGDVLDMKTSDITLAFIAGRQIDLNNKQKALDEKFRKKYGLN